MAELVKFICVDENEVSIRMCSYVIDVAKQAVDRSGTFTVGLSGGSAAKYLCRHLPGMETEWSKWRVFFCDERHVSQTDPESTGGFYRQQLFNHVSIQNEHIYEDNTSLSVEDAAVHYTKKLESVFGSDDIPRFDLLVLGMGPDGHTCSLFPGHHLLQENKRWVASISDSPKPPPQRITFTFPVLLNARCVIYVACGSSKAEIVKRVIERTDDPALPAAKVQPLNGKLVWFLDEAAASQLSTES